MIVSILQENLLKALQRGTRILSNKPSLPVLQNVLLVASEGRLTITTSSLDITEVDSVGAKVEEEGGLCVPAKLLTELVGSLPAETVKLEVQDGSLRVSCRGAKAVIPGISQSEFPAVSSKKHEGAMRLDKNLLVEAIKKVQYCAATDDGRPLLTGVSVKGVGGALTIAATDGYRLSVSHVALDLKEEINMVIPARALLEVVKISQEEKDLKEIQFSKTEDGQLVLALGDTDVFTRLIDGDYPNYQKIIPSKYTTQVRVSVTALVRAVKSASIFARDNANIIKLHIEKSSMVVSANTPTVGENSVEVEADVVGDGGDIAFNCRFLTEFLNTISGDELVFEMTGALNSGVFRLPKDESFLHVIMPVRVTSG